MLQDDTWNMDDNKESNADIDEKNDEQYYNSDSDDNHEVLVHDHDLRQPIHELANSEFQKSSFVKCIGQLYIEYNYPQNNYKLSLTGTGTVIRVQTRDGYFSAATAFVLTAAHNARRTIWQCCDQYFERKKINNCPKCQKTLSKKIDSIMIKATSIKFQRRVIHISGFGNFEEAYECKIEYLDEWNYKAFPYPKSGFDWALLSFIDNGNYYWNNCTKIELEAMDTKQPKYEQFMIVGYPGEKSKEMWGYKMTQNAMTLKYKTSKKTGNVYLYHKEIDATPGQSGAAIATQIKGKIIVWGVHVGGNDKDKYNKYNVGTLLDKNIVENIEGIINGNMKWVDREDWNGKGASYFGFATINNMLCHGYGIYLYKNGESYEGSFKNGKMYGYGKYLFKNGESHEGSFKNGTMHGYGKCVYSGSSYYEGEWKNGNRHGHGKYVHKNGSYYEGSYENGKKHGDGKRVDQHGNIIWQGQYKNGSKCT